MNRETILDNEFFSLWYYPDHKIVHHKLHKYIYGAAFHELLNTGVQIFEEHGCQKWLSDDTSNVMLSPVDRVWGEQNWVPRVIAAGWKYWAIILPKGSLGERSMQETLALHAKMGVETYVCSAVDEGLQWLIDQGAEAE